MDSQAEGSVQEDNNTQQTDNGYEPPSELSGAHSLKQVCLARVMQCAIKRAEAFLHLDLCN